MDKSQVDEAWSQVGKTVTESMKAGKKERDQMNEAWDQVGKSVNEASELYVKELETYMAWAQNVRREILDHTFAMSRQLSRMSEAQFAFLARMPRNFPLFGGVPTWMSGMTPDADEERPGRAD